MEEERDSIVEVVVEGLLGSTGEPLTLALSNPDHMTILCGTNGSGKTTVLRTINGVLNSDINELQRSVFERVRFRTSAGVELKVERHRLTAATGKLDRWHRQAYLRGDSTFSFILTKPDVKRAQHWTATPWVNYSVGSDWLASYDRQPRDDTAHLRSLEREVYRQYLELHRRPSHTESSKADLEGSDGESAPSWLSSFVHGQSCMYIPASRESTSPRMGRGNLKLAQDSTDSQNADDSPLAQRSRQLISLAGDARQQYARKAAQHDQSFLTDLLELARSVRREHQAPTERELKRKWREMQDRQKQLVRFGLVDSFLAGQALGSITSLVDMQRSILDMYCSAMLLKMGAFDDFRVPWEQLLTTLNEGLFDVHDKQLDENAIEGFKFRKRRVSNKKRTHLDFRDLSSGEQQEVTLQFDQTFGAQRGGILLVDEPEISLHVDWQQRYLDDLEKVASARGFYCIVATHSPTILSGHGDSVVELGRR